MCAPGRHGSIFLFSNRWPAVLFSFCQDLDAILKKEAPAVPTWPDGIDGRSSAGQKQSKRCLKGVAPPASSGLSMSLESLRDASSGLRGLLLLLNTLHASCAEESAELAQAREGGIRL